MGTQQLDFLGNYQCRLNFLDNIMHKEARAQVPIFDITQMGYLSIMGTWILFRYPFQGLFKIKRNILGCRIALSTFDNNYLLGNIHSYSIAS